MKLTLPTLLALTGLVVVTTVFGKVLQFSWQEICVIIAIVWLKEMF